jgi:hypothetical protein
MVIYQKDNQEQRRTTAAHAAKGNRNALTCESGGVSQNHVLKHGHTPARAEEDHE